MTGSDIISLLLLVLFPVVGASVGYALARTGWRLLAWALVAALLMLAVILVLQSRQAEGWDRLGLYVVGIGYVLPAAICAGVGAGFGRRIRVRRRGQKDK